MRAGVTDTEQAFKQEAEADHGLLQASDQSCISRAGASEGLRGCEGQALRQLPWLQSHPLLLLSSLNTPFAFL